MPPAPPLALIAGTTPLVLVAPHGGRRDMARRPWGTAPLKVNDLHTAALTAELARAAGASAIINTAADRNDVDLNRVSAAHDRAPWFLERLADVLAATLGRHGRATLLTVHGWNVVQPAVDLGLGCAPGADPFSVGPDAAVSPAFAAAAVRALVGACAGHRIAATVGARYPARARENLLQLFTPRYAGDRRSLVAALAAMAPAVDAVQLELGIPLRWPGPWRTWFVEACRQALPSLTAGERDMAGGEPAADGAASALVPCRLQFAGVPFCGLAAVGTDGGARLLLLPSDGGLLLFTGERAGGLAVATTGPGAVSLAYAGPLLRFPDTAPFLDLERGLAAARLVDADVQLTFTPAHAGGEASEFGSVAGTVALGGRRVDISATAFAEDRERPGPWPRLRAALQLDRTTALSLTLGLAGQEAAGFLCRAGRHVDVTAARASLGPAAAPLERVTLEVELAGGERLRVATAAVHELPVIRSRGPSAVRVVFAACAVDGSPAPAGWCEAGGI